jgi:TolB-like protein/DNA-binding SARP family transcriptional activator/tetratricopeptide (TPR) repeat protein
MFADTMRRAAESGVSQGVSRALTRKLSVPSPSFSLYSLGELRLVGPSGVVLAGRRKELVLLTYIARRAPRTVSREELAALLWGDRDEDKARQSLRHALHQLRRAVDDAIDVTSEHVRAVDGMIEVDASLLERDIADGRLDHAVNRWTGEFLPGAEDAGGDTCRAWIDREREALRRTTVGAFARLVDGARAGAQADQEVRWARSWAERFPLDDAAHARLVDVLHRQGDVEDARSVHSAFVIRLRGELDLPPSVELIRLGEQISRATAPERSRRRGSGAIVTPELVGRGAAIAAALVESWSRIRGEGCGVVIEGEEGTGKTRLCAELVRRVRATNQPALVLESRGAAEDGGASLSTFRRLMGPLVSAPVIEDVSAKALAELSSLLPALRERFPHLAAPTGSPDRAEASFRDVVRVVGATTPLLIVVDDFGRADRESQHLLRAVLATASRGTMVMLTLRSGDVSDAAHASDLGELAGVRRYKLVPLSEEEVASLVDSMVDIAPNDRAVLARRLVEEGGGNPSYVTALVSALAENGALTLSERGVWHLGPEFSARPLPVPLTLRDGPRRRRAAAALDDASVSALPATVPIAPRLSPKRGWVVAAAVGVVLVAASAAIVRGVASSASRVATAAAATPRLAVLDLELLSRDSLDAYLASGLAEEINASLSRFDDLRIKSRGAVRTVRAAGVIDPVELGRALLVDYLVEGNVRRIDQRIKVGIRLTKASDGFQVWSEDFDAASAALPSLHDRIAREIASRIGARLSTGPASPQRRAPTADAGAYEHYLRGNYYLARRTPPTVEQAIGHYRLAVARDSTFAAARARIAYSYALLLDWGWALDAAGSNEELVREGLRLVQSALEIDSLSTDAWMARAYLLAHADPVRMRGAAEAFERAIALDPRNVEAIHQYAQVHEALGNWDPALAAFRRTLLLEPDRSLPYVAMASIEWKRGAPRVARRLYDSALVVDPGASYALSARALLRIAEGDVTGGLADAETAVRIADGYAIPPYSVLAIALARTGSQVRAELEVDRALSELRDPSAPSPTDVRFIASALLAVGRRDEALAILERGRPRGAWLWFYCLAPDFDPIRKDPRFVRVMAEAKPPATSQPLGVDALKESMR